MAREKRRPRTSGSRYWAGEARWSLPGVAELFLASSACIFFFMSPANELTPFLDPRLSLAAHVKIEWRF